MTVADDLRRLSGDDDVEARLEGLKEELWQRITVLNAKAWEGRVSKSQIERWLANFDGQTGRSPEEERLHALFVLSQFLYFGSREIRILLRAVFRDLFLIPLVQEVRSSLGNIRDEAAITVATKQALDRTRFLGVGNPSESGVHLLYFFRQENGLTKNHFLDTAQILERASTNPTTWRLRHPDIERYIFVDDVCGTGETAINYSKDLLPEIKALKPTVQFSYLAMFGTEAGMNEVRTQTLFGGSTAAVYELDPSYKCLSDISRYLKAAPGGIDPQIVRSVGDFYGNALFPGKGAGYGGGGLLLGFHHNTPDNTLPIIWAEALHGAKIGWLPAFKRYPKI